MRKAKGVEAAREKAAQDAEREGRYAEIRRRRLEVRQKQAEEAERHPALETPRTLLGS